MVWVASLILAQIMAYNWGALGVYCGVYETVDATNASMDTEMSRKKELYKTTLKKPEKNLVVIDPLREYLGLYHQN